MEPEPELERGTTPSPSRLMGAASMGGIRLLARHSLLARLTRAARNVLQHSLHEPQSLSLQVERAMVLFKSGHLDAHISKALGTSLRLGMDMETCDSKSTEKRHLFSVTRKGRPSQSSLGEIRLYNVHSVNPRTQVETTIDGTYIDLLELRVRLLHCPVSLQNQDRDGVQIGQLALTAMTDLHHRHRVTLESMMGSEGDKHSISSAISSDFLIRPSWGLSSTHKFNKRLTVFSRYNNEKHNGQRLILQGVYKVNEQDTFSSICAAGLQGRFQGGISWIRQLSKGSKNEEALELKALCSSNGTFFFGVKAQVGQLES